MRGERRGVYLRFVFCSLFFSRDISLFGSEKVNRCLSSRWFSSKKRRDSPSSWLVDETEASLSVDRRRIDDSLSLGGSSMIRRRTSLSLGGCPRSLNLSLSVGLLDGEGPLSPCGSSRIERFDDVSRWLSSTATELSAGGSPRRRLGSLSFALRDLFRYTSCGKRAEEALSNNGLQYQNSFLFLLNTIQLTLFSAFILLYLLIFFYPFPFPDMDSTPYAHTTNFVELLNSQQDTVFHLVEDSVDPNSSHVPVFGSQSTEASNLGVDKPSERRERRTWSPADDLVLISAWLNMSKDPLVASESVKENDAEVDDGTIRPPGVKAAKARGKKMPMVEKSEFQTMCTIKQEDLAVKERLGKMKLLDSLIAKQEPLADEEAALKKKLILDESVKENDAEVDDGTIRPPGVKAAKARGKKMPMVEKSEFQTMCTIKQEDLAVKERLGKMKLLDSLIAKQEPLADEEAALKKKLILELMSN
ncbi:hypothetical protein F2Q70_00022743 [Brassica cretica]|uniref:No apical meristem-associated C-terminal domain-containing protein n=1 Tax=Brassica cretica TaxID=69181 RepID=A0A8S9GHF9_BRACR|nr:hypothetical protein F2Q70_00022743 [Brassica cretica]